MRPAFSPPNGLLAWCLLLLTLLLAATAQEAPGWVRVARAQLEILEGPAQTPAQQEVALPYHWDRVIARVDGVASFRAQVHWPHTGRPVALYFPRIGNAYAVFINGHEVARSGLWPPGPGNGTEREPQWVSVPPDLQDLIEAARR